MIFSTAMVLAKSTPIVGGTVISAKFHNYEILQNFEGIQFAGCIFPRNIQITGCTFKNCTFYKCTFACDFVDCKIIDSRFTECGFWHMDMIDVSLESSDIVDSDFEHCSLKAMFGGMIIGGSLSFCRKGNGTTPLVSCKLNYVSLNEPDNI